MSWHYSRALVAEYSVGNCLDGEPSAQSKSTTTAGTFSCKDKTTDTSSHSQFGMTCERSTVDHGEDVLTSFLEDFPVRIFRSQERGLASTENAAGCGQKWHASFAKYDRDLCSWRTLHSLFPEVL